MKTAELIKQQGGYALIIALGVLFVATLLLVGLTETTWATVQAARAQRVQTQLRLAASSNARFHHWWLSRDILAEKLVSNILDQGCKQQTPDYRDCAAPGNDLARTSGVRRDVFPQLAARSQMGFDQAQLEFVTLLSQVMPPAPERDQYRTPSFFGFGGLQFGGGSFGASVPTRWRTYSHVHVSPTRYVFEQVSGPDGSLLEARVYFDVVVYGWARPETQDGREARYRWQVSMWSRESVLYMRYPSCPDSYRGQPGYDSVCMYPEYVSVTVTPPTSVVGQHGVVMDPWSVRP